MRLTVLLRIFPGLTQRFRRALALVGTYSFAEGARNNLVLLERALSTAIRLGIVRDPERCSYVDAET